MTEHTTWTRIPYPSENDDPWQTGFKSSMDTIDAAQYAHREDRHLIISGGGTVAWNAATGVLSWSAEIQILAAITGRQWTIAAGNVVLSASVGLIALTSIPRAPTANTVVTVSAGSVVPGLAGGNNALALAVRVGDILHLRTGISIASGSSVTGFSPQLPGPVIVPPDIRTSAIIVGNATEGDTVLTCDYLDVGDGVQLETALAAAGAGATPLDVYIKPGTYDLDAGAVMARLVIPTGVRGRGAGRYSTIISTRTTGDGRAFVLAEDATIEDVGVFCPVPTAPQAGAQGIISLNMRGAEARRCRVEFDGGWAAIGNWAWVAVETPFYIGNTVLSGDVRVVDCEAVDVPFSGAGGGIVMSGLYSVAGATGRLYATRVETDGGDQGMHFAGGRAYADACDVHDALVGVIITAARSRFSGGRVVIPSAANQVGITINGVDGVEVSDNWVRASTGAALSVAIQNNGGSQCVITGNRGNGNAAPPAGWPTSVGLSVGANNNIVNSNNFGGGAAAVDLGAGNDVSHNL